MWAMVCVQKGCHVQRVVSPTTHLLFLSFVESLANAKVFVDEALDASLDGPGMNSTTNQVPFANTLSYLSPCEWLLF